MRTPHDLPADLRARLAVAVVVVAVALMGGIAAVGSSAATLAVEVDVVAATPNGSPDTLTVRISNEGATPVRPRVSSWHADRKLITFWTRTSGPETLAPGESARYRLVAPNTTLKPGVPTHLAVSDGQRRTSLAFVPHNDSHVRR